MLATSTPTLQRIRLEYQDREKKKQQRLDRSCKKALFDKQRRAPCRRTKRSEDTLVTAPRDSSCSNVRGRKKANRQSDEIVGVAGRVKEKDEKLKGRRKDRTRKVENRRKKVQPKRKATCRNAVIRRTKQYSGELPCKPTLPSRKPTWLQRVSVTGSLCFFYYVSYLFIYFDTHL